MRCHGIEQKIRVEEVEGAPKAFCSFPDMRYGRGTLIRVGRLREQKVTKTKAMTEILIVGWISTTL